MASDACSCCGRPWTVCFPEVEPRMQRASRAFVCADCRDHQGMTMRSDPAHIELWRSLLNRRQRAHERAESQLRARIDDLEQQLRDRPEKVVERRMGGEEMDAAKAEAERAFRSRENAWQALTEIRLLHREADSGQCRCRKRLDRCPEAQIVDRYPGLAKWENDQVRRLRQGLSHTLPDNHPAILDRRWLADGA